jgi:hypothetical protein
MVEQKNTLIENVADSMKASLLKKAAQETTLKMKQ